jgi:hypothetical protein
MVSFSVQAVNDEFSVEYIDALTGCIVHVSCHSLPPSHTGKELITRFYKTNHQIPKRYTEHP